MKLTKSIAIVFVLTVVLVAFGCGGEMPPTKSHLFNGDYYAYKKEYQKAIDEYSKEFAAKTPYASLAATKRKSIFEVYVSSHKSNQDLKLLQTYTKDSEDLEMDYTQSIEAYSKAIIENSQPYLYAARADIAMEHYDFASAVADYSKAIELDPNNAELYIWRANAYCNKYDYKRALEDSERALALDAQNPRAYWMCCKVHRCRKDYEKALAVCNQAVEVVPQNTLGYMWRARVYSDREEYQKELLDINKAIEMAPCNKWCYLFRADIYWDQKTTQRHWKIAIKLSN